MKNTNTHGMVAAIEIINAALASNGQAAFRPKLGSFEFMFIEKMYHETRRALLIDMKPDFAVNDSPEKLGAVRYLDGYLVPHGEIISGVLKKLGDGRCVYDVEFVTEFSDEFINAFIDKLAEKFAPFGRSLTSRRSRRGGFGMW